MRAVHTPDGETVAQFAGLVLQFRGATVADVYEARRALDLAALRIIVGRGSLWDFVALDENVATMGRATEPGDIVELHDEFHTLLVELAGNQTLVVFEQMIHRIIGRHGRFQVRAARPTRGARQRGGGRTYPRGSWSCSGMAATPTRRSRCGAVTSTSSPGWCCSATTRRRCSNSWTEIVQANGRRTSGMMLRTRGRVMTGTGEAFDYVIVGADRRAACSPTACRRTRPTGCCSSRRAARTTT